MDEQYIKNLYQQLVSIDPSFKNDISFDKFVNSVKDPSYASSLYSQLNGIDNTFKNDVSLDSFLAAVGAAKKKDATVISGESTLASTLPQVSSSVSSSSQSTPQSPEMQQFADRFLGQQLQQPQQPQAKPNITGADDITGTTIVNGQKVMTTSQADRAKWSTIPTSSDRPIIDREKPVDIFKSFKEVTQGPIETEQQKAEKMSFVEPLIKSLDSDFIQLDEEAAVPKLRYLFEPLGFKFEESGIGDYVTVTAPDNATKTTIPLDPFFGIGAANSSEQLKNFIRNNTQGIRKETLDEISSKYTNENKKYATEEEYKTDANYLNTEASKIISEEADIKKSYANLEAETNMLNSMPEYQRNTPEYIEKARDLQLKLNALQERVDYVAESRKKLSESPLAKATGQYVYMKAQQGGPLGGLINKFTEGYGRIFNDKAGNLVQLVVQSRPTDELFQMGNNRKYASEIAQKKGLKPLEEGVGHQKFMEWLNSLPDSDRQDVIDGVQDRIVKGVKYGDEYGEGISNKIRPALTNLIGDKSTTEEYVKDIEQNNFVGGAVLGAAGSIPAMLGPSPLRVFSMMAQASDYLDQEMQDNPNFKDISEADKNKLKFLIGVPVAALEEFGFRNLISNSSVINNLIYRAVGNSGGKLTGKTFAEFVRNDVKNGFARAGLTALGATLAEAETGASQQAVEIAIKDAYNKNKLLFLDNPENKKMFDSPDFLSPKTIITGDAMYEILKGGAQEAIGGFVLGIPNSVAAGMRGKGFTGMSDTQFKAFESMANDDNIQSAWISTLKARVANGDITAAEARNQLNDYRNAIGLYRSLPENLTIGQKKEAMNLIRERNAIKQSIQDKDPQLTIKQQDRINQINEQLKNLPENAIQEPSTEEGVLRPEQPQVELPKVGEGNAQEQAPAQVTQQEQFTEQDKGRQEVLASAIKEAKDNDSETVTIGDQTMTLDEAENEAADLFTKQIMAERAAPAPVMETAPAPVVEAAPTPVMPTTEGSTTTATPRNTDLFPNEISFAQDNTPSTISDFAEVNGIGVATYTNPETGDVDTIMSGTSDNDFVGFIRVYENGKPTNKFTSKMSNESGNKADFKTMLSEAQKRLPQGHLYTETKSVSMDGVRVYANQLGRGYEVATDANGNPMTTNVTLNNASVEGLRNARDQNQKEALYNKKLVKSAEEFEAIKAKILEMLPQAKVTLNTANNSVMISLPVLKYTGTTTTTTPTTTTQTTTQVAPTTTQAAPTAAPTATPPMPGMHTTSNRQSMTDLENKVAQEEKSAKTRDQKNAVNTKKRVIATANRAVNTLKSIFPNADIHLHTDDNVYNSLMEKYKGKKNSRGNIAIGKDDNGNIFVRIDINLNKANATTVAHEVAHAVLYSAFNNDTAVYTDFRDRISKILKSSTNKKLQDFANRYSEADRDEEFLVELTGMLEQNQASLDMTTLQRIAKVINDIVSKLTNGAIQPFRESINNRSDAADLITFMNGLANAMREGKGITIKEGKVATVDQQQGGNNIKSLNTQEAYSNSISIPISNPNEFTSKKIKRGVKSKSQIADYELPDNIEILKTANLPVKNLTDLVRQYNGRVVIITSDATGYGIDKNKDPIFGGFGFSANLKNVNDGIGFASVSIGTVKGTYTAAEKAYGQGKVLVLVMIQPPHTTINNSYGAKYIIRGIKEIASQSSEELYKTKEAIKDFIKNSTAIQNELKTNDISLKRGSENKLIELIDSINENTDLDAAVEKFIANTTFTIRKELGKGIILEHKNIRTNKSTNYAKIALNNVGYNIFDFLKEYGDNTFLNDNIILNNTGGFVVGGFELDILPTEQREKLIFDIQSKGIVHPLFNAKLPGTNHFRLDGLYDVQENFSEYVRPETKITLNEKERDELVREYYKDNKFYQEKYRSIPLEKRTYTQLTVPYKTEFKEKYLKDKGYLIETTPNIATKVAKGEGFIPKLGASEQMAKATYVSKSSLPELASVEATAKALEVVDVAKLLGKSSLIDSKERTSFTKNNKTYSIGDVIDGNKLDELSGNLIGNQPTKKYILIQTPLSEFTYTREELLEQEKGYEQEESDRLESMKEDFNKTPPIPMEGDGMHRIIAAKELGHKTILMWQEISPKSISEAYHKAKADGSNPELVKAVEDLITESTTGGEVTSKSQLTEDEAKRVVEQARASSLSDIKIRSILTTLRASQEMIEKLLDIKGDIAKFIDKQRGNGVTDDKIRTSLQTKGYEDAEIDDVMETEKGAAPKVELSEETLPGYDRMMREVNGIIEKSKGRLRNKTQILNSVISYIQGSKAYENASAIQQEQIIRDVQNMLGIKQKAAPTKEKVLGVKPKMVTVNDMSALKDQIRLIARTARQTKQSIDKVRQDIADQINDFKQKGKITLAQAQTIINRGMKLNVLNPAKVDKFINYVSNVFKDAEYDEKIRNIRKKIKQAKENIKTKLGGEVGLISSLRELLSIDPEMIPLDMLSDYTSLVDMLSGREKVLQLDDINNVKNTVDNILNAIYNEQSLAIELADKFDNYENKIEDDGKIDFSATIKQMIKDGIITEEEADIMRKYRSEIMPTEEDTKETAEEKKARVEEERKVIIDELLNNTEVRPESLSESRDNREKAGRIKKLLTRQILSRLSLNELKNLAKVIDNINNGYFTNAAQIMMEKMNSIKNAYSLTGSILNAVPLTLTRFMARIKTIMSNTKTSMDDIARRGPLYYIDQQFGNFKTKSIYDALFSAASASEGLFKSQAESINQRLNNIMKNINKSLPIVDRNRPNALLMSSYKMMTYMIQKEYLSNPGSKQVKPAHMFLEKTIKHLEDTGDYRGAEMLREILNKYSTDGQIDLDKLDRSFTKAMRDGIAEIRKINDELTDKAIHTASVIRGIKINPLNNYIHLSVSDQYDPTRNQSATEIADSFNRSLMPGTRSKSLIERTGAVSPLNFDIFSSVKNGARSVLLDYHLTEAIRTARRTINETGKMLDESGRRNKDKNNIYRAISGAFNEAVENLLQNNFLANDSFDEALDYIAKQGYRATLASSYRFISELKSNIAMALIYAPKAFAKGITYSSMIMSEKGIEVARNLKMKQISRLYSADALSGKLLDRSILSEKQGVNSAKAKGVIADISTQIYNASLKKLENSVAFIADSITTAPDMMVMRPVWFGSFAEKFKELTGTEVDFDKIADNDESYMNQYKDAINEATDTADRDSVFVGGAKGSFMGMQRGKNKQTISQKIYNNFNNFMVTFQIFDYIAARTAIQAMMGKGQISRVKGMQLLAAITTRSLVYAMLTKTLGEAMVGLFVAGDDDEDEKSFWQQFQQAMAATFTSLFLGRDFGNASRMIINFGADFVNEEFLTNLRDGEYDYYKDNIGYSALAQARNQSDSKTVTLLDFILNLSGQYGPALNTAGLIVKKTFGTPKKTESAINRDEAEKQVRIPLEVLGNAGFIPLYKDVRKVVMAEIYKDLKQEKRDEQKNKELKSIIEPPIPAPYKNWTEVEDADPELYNQLMGPESPYYEERKAIKDKEKAERETKKKERYQELGIEMPEKGRGGRPKKSDRGWNSPYKSPSRSTYKSSWSR